MVQNQIEREDRLEKKRLERDEKAAQRQAQKAAEMCKINQKEKIGQEKRDARKR